MYKILEARELTTNIYLMVVEAPRVAKNCNPGQFVIVRMDKDGEVVRKRHHVLWNIRAHQDPLEQSQE